MQDWIQFLVTSSGRLARVASGVLLIVVGLVALGGAPGWVLAAIGLVPIAAAVFDLCLMAPLAGLPLQGVRIRARLEQHGKS